MITIDRTDGTNNTPSKREYVTFTGISGNDLTGCTRGVAGSSAQQHSSGAKVETMPTVTHWNDLIDFLRVEHDANGKHVISTATISYTQTHQLAVTSLASISALFVSTRLNASGASITGLGIGHTAVFSFVGGLSGPTTSIQTALIMPESGTLQWVSYITRTVASGASAIVDINKNGTSIFDAGTRPTITGGGTFVSTASIATKSFVKGDRFTWDYDTTGGYIVDFNIFLRSE